MNHVETKVSNTASTYTRKYRSNTVRQHIRKHKHIRRSQHNKETDRFKVTYATARGITGKMESLYGTIE